MQELRKEEPPVVEDVMEVDEEKGESEKAEEKHRQADDEGSADAEKNRPAKRRKRVRSEGNTKAKSQGDTPKRTGITFPFFVSIR